MAAVNAKQAQKAFEMLSPLEATRAGDPDFDTAFGIAANEVGQHARAIFALERVMVVQPANGRARAELARALFAVGDVANARKLLQETKAEGVPEGVARTIDEFLQAIDKVDEAGRPSARIYVDVGFGYDSNVNSGPINSSFAVPALGGAVVTLLPAAVKTDATFVQLGAGVSGRTNLMPRWSALANASFSTRKYGNNASAFNFDQVDLNAGASYRDDRHEFSGVANFAQASIGGSTVRRLSGITGEWTYRPDGTRQWGTYAQWSSLDYPAQPARDARRTVLGTSYAFQSGQGALYYLGGYAGRERQDDATFPHLGHRLGGLRLGMQMAVSAAWGLFATASLEDRRYGGVDPLFLSVRKDTQLDLSVGASMKWSDRWRITPQVNYNRSKSNHAVNDSSKASMSVTARREF